MLNHLPILQVIIPLLAAPACLLIGRPRLVWIFALGVSAGALLISALLLQQVVSSGTISYALGGWDAPWGIEYRIDLLNAFVLLIISAISTVVLLGAHTSVQREVAADKQSLFYVSYLLCLAGLLGIAASGDVFNVFVFLEISALSTYTLIAMGQNRRALWASYQYLLMGTVGATFILIGIGFLYAMTGTLNMQDLAERLAAVQSSSAVLTAFAFIIVGVGLKLALFPLHLWLPNAYAYAPSVVTAFLAATATKVAVYLLIRFSFGVFGLSFFAQALPLNEIYLALGGLGVLIASLVAIYQDNIKRLFAYSSVAQIGYMIIGIGIGSAAGLQATLLHLFNHALMKGAIFLALAAVVFRLGGMNVETFRGAGRRMPWTMAAIVAASLSLIGMPLTVGFVSKWYLILAAVEAGMWPVAVLVVAGSLLAVIYTWKIVEAAYFTNSGAERQEAPWSLLLPVWLLVFANIYFGIDTRLPVTVTELAAGFLMGAER